MKIKDKGFSIQSIIIGSIILSILTVAATSNLWPVAEDSKTGVIVSFIQEQQGYINSELNRGFGYIESVNDPANGGDAKVQDYLGDLIAAGRLSSLPLRLFEEPAALTWEIRGLTKGGVLRAYYIHISSTNDVDAALITSAINQLMIPTGNLM